MRGSCPVIGIKSLCVRQNSDKYNKWCALKNAIEHQLHVEDHVDKARRKVREANDAWLAVQSTSGSSTT
jgi:Na+-transporting NADH:ubiquinone oxidoreductase subunit NqrB